jgi:hypothetical protein
MLVASLPLVEDAYSGNIYLVCISTDNCLMAFTTCKLDVYADVTFISRKLFILPSLCVT